jgi:predicted dinucleotide-binding enzyme
VVEPTTNVEDDMSTVTIIGTGNMATAIAGLAAKAGSPVQVLDRDAAKAQTLAEQVGGTAGTVGDEVTGEVVVLAVPYAALDELAATYAGRLDGRTVVDITNPVDFATFDALVVPADSSAAAALAAKLPGAGVVKAFNTTFSGALAGPTPPAVLVAGDDAQAKARVAEAFGAAVAVVDAGSLRRARELEALGFLQITLAAAGATPWTGGFSLEH